MAQKNTSKQVKQRLGRPLEYRPEFCEMLDKLPEDSAATIGDIAKLLGVARATVNDWMVKYEDFSDAVLRARMKADEKIVNATYERALGYTETVTEERLDKDGCVHTLTKEIHIPGSEAQQRFWLQNRQPDDWADRKELKVTTSWHELLLQEEVEE